MRSTPVYARNASDHQCKDHVNYQISIITFWTESTRSWFAVSSASKAWCSCSLLWRFVMSRNDSSEAISVFSPIHPSTYTNKWVYMKYIQKHKRYLYFVHVTQCYTSVTSCRNSWSLLESWSFFILCCESCFKRLYLPRTASLQFRNINVIV